MAIKKFADLANETDSKFNNVKSSKARAKISERFDDTTHNEQPSDEALQYLNKKIDECIDSVNTNTNKTGISTSQANAITANSAKTGITDLQANAITTNSAKVSSPFPALTTKQSGVTVSISSLQHTPAVGDANDTLTMTLTIVNAKGAKTLKTFVLTAS
tara:strand:- start:154 stop:633 length:480 start_codon:yes stop_codon:yes gene_type:complete